MSDKENLMKKHLCTTCKTNCMDREPLLPKIVIKCKFYADTTPQPSPKCKKCGRPAPEYVIKDFKVLEYDPCIGMLPGVISACCGHGSKEGHLIFENGTKLVFDSKSLKVGKVNKSQSLISMPNETRNLCGYNEPCFEPGPQWGHNENVLCKFNSGGGEYQPFKCKKINKTIQPQHVYIIEAQYNNLQEKR